MYDQGQSRRAGGTSHRLGDDGSGARLLGPLGAVWAVRAVGPLDPVGLVQAQALVGLVLLRYIGSEEK